MNAEEWIEAVRTECEDAAGEPIAKIVIVAELAAKRPNGDTRTATIHNLANADREALLMLALENIGRQRILDGG